MSDPSSISVEVPAGAGSPSSTTVRDNPPVAARSFPRKTAMKGRKSTQILAIAGLAVALFAAGAAVAGLVLGVQGGDRIQASDQQHTQVAAAVNASLLSEVENRQASIQAEAIERRAEQRVLNSSLHAALSDEAIGRQSDVQMLNSSLSDKDSRLQQLECRLSLCANHGSCSADLTTCTCDAGFSGPSCSDCAVGYFGLSCLPCSLNCGSHGSCDDGLTGSGKCDCDAGWTGTECSVCSQNFFGSACDPCPSCGSNGICMDGLLGSGKCFCMDGWRGDNCSSCAVGYYGPTCEPCFCSGRGSCDSGLDGTGCVCNEGWAGSKCDECEQDYFGSTCAACPTCPLNGYCLDGLAGNGSCTCNEGFQAPNCTSCLPGFYGPSCSACPDCGDHGACNDGSSGNGQCACDAGWSGTLCDECAADYFGSSCTACPNCGVNGACNASLSGDGSCICNTGATGSLCESCESDYFGASCSACPSCVNGACSDGLTGSGTCTCDSGWTGALCDECASDYFGASCSACPNCGDHGTCADGINGTGLCDCATGWSGAACQSCADGYYGSSCTACPDCGQHGSCADGSMGSGICMCDSGWTGSLCDDCSPNYYGNNCTLCEDCGLNSECLDGLLGNGSCVCTIGWEGSYCNVSQLFYKNAVSTKTQDPTSGVDEYLGLGGAALSADALVLAAAASRASDKGVNSGSVTVWQRPDTSTDFASGQRWKLLDPQGSENDKLGESGVALSTDGLTVAAAAPGQIDDTGEGTNSKTGVILVWQRSARTVDFDSVTPFEVIDASAVESDLFGAGGVALCANNLILVSSEYGSATKGTDSGSILVWQRSSTTVDYGTLTPTKLVDPNGQANDRLGDGKIAISADGLVLAAGASGHSSYRGAVFVWQRSGTSVDFSTLNPIELTDPEGSQNNYFSTGGVAMTPDGLAIAAGAYYDDTIDLMNGAVLVWQRTQLSDSWDSVTPTRLLDPDGARKDALGMGGAAFSSDGLFLASSSRGDDDNGSNSGSVLVWERSNATEDFSSVVPVKLIDPTGGVVDLLGNGGVALSGDGHVLAATVASGADDKGFVIIWE